MSVMAAAVQLEDRHAQPDSVGARYIVTLAAQGFRLFASLIVAMVVPRTLGPAVYGNYSFLLSTAAALRALVDTGSQQAFFTFSSQERASGPLTKLYAWALAGQFAIGLTIVGVVIASGTSDWIWHGQQPDQIVWVTLLDWAIFLALSLQQLGDSKGLTVYPQLIGAGVSFASLIVLLLLWWTGALGFYTFVWLNLASAGINCALLLRWTLGRNRGLFWDGALAAGAYLRRWWSFASPLILLQYYLPVVAWLGVYLVQRWNGAQEQGYYALALQWSSLALVFTNAGVSIFWREIAQHNARRDLAVAAETYERFSRLLFFLAMALAGWLSASSAMLVDLVAGPRYAPAVGVVAIMAFYPAAQTIGQLSVAALKAAERTAPYARWSIILSVPDLLLTYFLLAPATGALPGLHLGAAGMAIKTALYGLASVQIYDWINYRSFGVSFAAVLARRVAAMAALGLVAFVVLRLGGAWLVDIGVPQLATLVLASCVYGIAVAAIIWWRPELAGLSRPQILSVLRGRSQRAPDQLDPRSK